MDVHGLRTKYVDIHIHEVLAPQFPGIGKTFLKLKKIKKKSWQYLGGFPSEYRYLWICRKPLTKLQYMRIFTHLRINFSAG